MRMRSKVQYVFYFCENEDLTDVLKIIEVISIELPDLVFRRSLYDSVGSVWQEMLMMSLCARIIIANSTFSWWAAMLHDSRLSIGQDQVVCYPSTWFGPDLSHLSTIDMFPSFWNRIEDTNFSSLNQSLFNNDSESVSSLSIILRPDADRNVFCKKQKQAGKCSNKSQKCVTKTNRIATLLAMIIIPRHLRGYM